ncbi:outer membrane beta-barrel protein [Alteromonas sp. 14N.309.X.WAT.G.H12]|uniref:outer membrane beta-barrel protein n=1 Tax=Alteromonas sp. 14N.309.X.WAT.G.H12 TaxID=3120824 RepID=UPI002FD74216
MKKTFIASAILLGVAASSSAFAGVTETAPDFSYIDVGYTSYDLDDTDVDADGITIGGAFEISESAFINYSYSTVSIDDYDADMDTYSIGIGARHALTYSTSLFGSVNYIRSDVDAYGYDDSFNGYGVSAGVKSRISSEIELTGTLSYTNMDMDGYDDEDDVTGELGARYYFTNDIAIGLTYQYNSDEQAFAVGARYSF